MSDTPINDSNKETFNWILNVTYGVSFACVGFIISLVFSNIDRLDQKMDRVPVEYIQKVDYRDDQDKIYEELKEMSRKFDENARSIKEDYNKRMDKMEKILTEQLTKRP
jgi:hypothetical protein